jgi:transposase
VCVLTQAGADPQHAASWTKDTHHMTMLADRVDAVIGVDTHTDTHTAAILNAGGGILHTVTVDSTEDGYGQLLDAVLDHAPGPRVAWAIEGTGSYGAGLKQALEHDGAEIIEVRAVKRARGQSKNDTNDAVTIARTALAQDTHARPRSGQTREALRILTLTRNQDVKTRTRLINTLKSLILTAATPVRDKFRGRTSTEQIAITMRLRAPKNATSDVLASIAAIRSSATQIRDLTTLIDTAEKDMTALLTLHAPQLLALYGVGPISAAQILLTFSHPGRFRSEAAFAAIAGTSPLEASSGRTVRHRLNRTGDRQLNAAIHRIMHTRKTRQHPDTIAYIARRSADGKTPKEINRLLKRYLTRHLYRLLETMPAMP